MLNFKNTTMVFIAITLLLMLASLFFYFSGWLYILLAIGYLVIIGVASFTMRANFFLNSFTGVPEQTSKVVALTFDDGPHPIHTKEVLSILKRYRATATFFCIGKNIEEHPEMLRRIQKGGHAIGNHSFSHKNFIAFNGTKCWIEEIEKTETTLQKLDVPLSKLFRPPFGVTTPHLAKAVEHTHQQVVGWNIRPFDTTRKDHQAVVAYIKQRIRPGAVILLHDTHERIALVLEQLLVFLQENGYETITIPQLMKHEP